MPSPVRTGRRLLHLAATLLPLALSLGAGGPALADFESGQRAYEDGDYGKALEAWLPLAEAGDVQALFRIGELYSGGKGVEQNFVTAHSNFMRAAMKGHPEAQYEAGDHLVHFNSAAPAEDKALGFALLMRAATNGQTLAYISISHAYCFGKGVEEDPVLADVWMVLALGPLSRFKSFLHCDVFTPLTPEYHAEIVRRAEGLSLAYGFKPYGSEDRP